MTNRAKYKNCIRRLKRLWLFIRDNEVVNKCKILAQYLKIKIMTTRQKNTGTWGMNYTTIIARWLNVLTF